MILNEYTLHECGGLGRIMEWIALYNYNIRKRPGVVLSEWRNTFTMKGKEKKRKKVPMRAHTLWTQKLRRATVDEL